MLTIKTIFLISIVFLLQTTFIPIVPIKEITPDLIVIIVVYFSLSVGKNKGIGIGFGVGFVQDCLSAVPTGINVLSKGIIGFGIGGLKDKILSENLISQCSFTFLASIVDSLMVLFVSKLFLLGDFNLLPSIGLVFYKALYTVSICPFCIIVLNWLCSSRDNKIAGQEGSN